MIEPTQEQINELWEWCGFRTDKDPLWWVNDEVAIPKHLFNVDLNNLFKYAVPKFEQCCIESMGGGHYGARVSLGDTLGQGEGKDPALALFWAIYEVMKDDSV